MRSRIRPVRPFAFREGDRQFADLHHGRRYVVGADFADPPGRVVEHISLAAALGGAGLALPVRPFDHRLVRVAANPHFFDGPLRTEVFHTPEPFTADGAGAAPGNVRLAERKLMDRVRREAAHLRVVINGVAGLKMAPDERFVRMHVGRAHLVSSIVRIQAIAGRPAATQVLCAARVSTRGGYRPHSDSPACTRSARYASRSSRASHRSAIPPA